MKQYLDLMRHVLKNGKVRDDRTGTGVIGVFGARMEFDLQEGFPLPTTRKIFSRGMIAETIWFMRGSTDARVLQDQGVKIWDEWAANKELTQCWQNINMEKVQEFTGSELVLPDFSTFTWGDVQEWFGSRKLDIDNYLYITEGDIGPMYGKQARAWPTASGSVDQIADVLATLRESPTDRRMCISHWNVDTLPLRGQSIEENLLEGRMALAPCHAFYQFYAEKMTTWERLTYLERHYATKYVEDNEEKFKAELAAVDAPLYKLSCQLYQRSVDICCGLPFNIASYSLLTHMFCHILNMVPGKFIHISGDVHIYLNHVDNAKKQVGRTPRQLPKLIINPKNRIIKDPAEFRLEDFEIKDYLPDEPLEYKVSK